jgi:hypothetical protein
MSPERPLFLRLFLTKEKYKFVDKNSARRKKRTSFQSISGRNNYTCLKQNRELCKEKHKLVITVRRRLELV